MKILKHIAAYLYHSITGSFIGFVIGMAATSLVSRFFETRSFKNLWGLTAKKRLVDKETFGYMEWAISIMIGFLVFELVNKVVKPRLEANFPCYKKRIKSWMMDKGIHQRINEWYILNRLRKAVLYFSAFTGTKNAIDKYSRK